MGVAVVTPPRRAKSKCAAKRQDSVPEDLRDFVVGRVTIDKLYTPKHTSDLSDGESGEDVFLTPPERMKLAKEVEDLTMSFELESSRPRTRKRKMSTDQYYTPRGNMHNDDDDEFSTPLKTEHKPYDQLDSSPLGSAATPIVISDDDDELITRKRVCLTPNSRPLKRQKYDNFEPKSPSTPTKIQLKVPKTEVLDVRPIVTPSRPQIRRLKRTAEISGINPTRISAASPHPKDDTAESQDQGLGFNGSSSCNDDSTAVDTNNASTEPPSDNAATHEWAARKVHVFSDLSKIQIPPDYHAMFERSDTGLPAFLELTKQRIMRYC